MGSSASSPAGSGIPAPNDVGSMGSGAGGGGRRSASQGPSTSRTSRRHRTTNSGASAPGSRSASASASPSRRSLNPPATGQTLGGGAGAGGHTNAAHLILNRPYSLHERSSTLQTTLGANDAGETGSSSGGAMPLPPALASRSSSGIPGGAATNDGDNESLVSAPSVAPTYIPPVGPSASYAYEVSTTTESRKVPAAPPEPALSSLPPVQCLNPASEINSRLDTQVEVKVYPCNNSSQPGGKKKFTTFTVKPEGVVIQGTNRNRSNPGNDLGAEYALHVGRKLQRYELSDTRACQLLVTTHHKSFWVVPAPEAFSRHSGTCRLLGDRKHPPAAHTLQVGDFLRVGSVGVVVIETHDGVENRVLSEEKIQKIMKDTTSPNGGFLDLGETDGENSDDSMTGEGPGRRSVGQTGGAPVCYMCFDEEDTIENPLIAPCKCLGDTRYVHVECLRKWHSAEADNQICFLSSVDATCSVCKSTFKSDFKLKDGRLVKLFKSSLEPPYVSLLVATKHEMAQRLFNTRFQLSFSTLLKPDGRNGTRPLLLGRSSGSDMVLDYRTVSARHASIRFKNGEFIFTDAGSSNGSYLYLRRPVELTPSQSVQFRLGRSMISMKVVNKWNRRLLRAVRRTGHSSSSGQPMGTGDGDDHSIGSNDDDVRITDGSGGFTRSVPRRTRESIMRSLPAPGTLSQNSHQHLDLLYALAYPKRDKETVRKKDSSGSKNRPVDIPDSDEGESKVEESELPSNSAPPPPDAGIDRFDRTGMDGADDADAGVDGTLHTSNSREQTGGVDRSPRGSPQRTAAQSYVAVVSS